MFNTSKVFLASSALLVALPGTSYPGYSKGGAGQKAPPATVGKKAFATNTKTSASAIDAVIPGIAVDSKNLGQLPNLSRLTKHETNDNPLGKDFDYRKAFAKLDFEQVKADMKAVMTNSKEFWPADYGHYGPLFIRLAWHSAGTYRSIDGRGGSDGGQMRFYPLANWPDNGNLDKARKLIQPVVEKYYPNLSWADAMILAGDLAMRDMGFETLGVAGGRTDDWAPDMVYWGPEDEFLKSERFDEEGNLQLPLAASVMGLIYVNPEGPDGKPDPLLSAERIRTTFGRMGMNDEETVALIAGGHTFGKAHGAPTPEACQAKTKKKGEEQNCAEAKGPNTNTSGIEGPWTSKPIQWTHEYLTNLYKYEWELAKSPQGRYQWFAKNLEESDFAPDAHDPSKLVPIMMLTTDLALRYDREYDKVARRFLEDPEEFGRAFARAWFKLIHRDLGPKTRYLGNEFPTEDFIWQDPVPAVNHELINKDDISKLKAELASSELSISDRVKTAWAAASSFRGADMRGGANGARLRLQPQRSWDVNEPERLASNLSILEGIQTRFNEEQAAQGSQKKISLADLIVLAGNSAVEQAAQKAGYTIDVPFNPGRADASQEQTDVQSFSLLELNADGFRNYFNADESYLDAERAFIDRADQLTLGKREMALLTAGLRVLGANHNNSKHGVFTKQPGTLSNDFFATLLDKSIKWVDSEDESGVFVGEDRLSGTRKWTATSQDLFFGRSNELRLIAFSYASKGSEQRFVNDFVQAWSKVMNLDRFDKAQ